MPRIFISYRRQDTATITGRIYDRLLRHYDSRDLFKDVEHIPPGSDFLEVITEFIEQCDVVLAVIGPNWIYDQNGNNLLARDDDYVSTEIKVALVNDVLIIPVLVDHTPPPAKHDLPPNLQKLAFRNAVAVREDPDFHTDMDRLINYLLTLSDETPTLTTGLVLNLQRKSRSWATMAGIAAFVAVVLVAAVLILFGGGNDNNNADVIASANQSAVATITQTATLTVFADAKQIETEVPSTSDAIEETSITTGTSFDTAAPTIVAVEPSATATNIQTATPTAMPTSTHEVLCTGIVNTTVVDPPNVRMGPSPEALVLRRLDHGSRVSVVAAAQFYSAIWLQVSTDDGMGWVNGNFILLDVACDLEALPLVPTNFPDLCFVQARLDADLYRYADFGTESLEIFLGRTTRLVIRYHQAGAIWYQVPLEIVSGHGWVSGQVVDVFGDCQPYTTNCFIESINGTNIRTGGSQNYPIMSEIYSNESRRVLGQYDGNNGWYLIEDPSGNGWVSASTVTLTGNCAALPPATFDPLPTESP